MGKTLLSILMALSITDNPESRHAKAQDMANNYCVKLNKSKGLECKVLQVVFSEAGNEYVDHATAFMSVSEKYAALSIGFRYGTWYVEAFDVEVSHDVH